MTTLAYDKPRSHGIAVEVLERAYPVVASDIIYAGAVVGINSAGNAGPLTGSGGGLNYFVGFAFKQADNSTGTAGQARVDVVQEGQVILSVTGVDSIDDVGKFVIASDDDTFYASATTDVATAGDAVIGKVSQYIGADGMRPEHVATTCLVSFVAHNRMPAGATLVTT